MKLGRIFLNSLLEARVNAITDKFFLRFNPYVNRPQYMKDDIAAIKKDIRSKESKNTYYDKDEDVYKVKADLWDREDLPEQKIKEVQETAAKEFIQSVFIKLNFIQDSIKYR
jgi:hypothetical protein